MDDPEIRSLSHVSSTAIEAPPPRGSDIIELQLTPSGSWTERRLGDIPKSEPPSQAVIYLFEGIDCRTRDLASSLLCDSAGSGADSFLRHHEGKGLLSPSEKALLYFQREACEEDTGVGLFLATWLTLASHDKGIWEIEKKIESGRPWCSSEQRDPADLRLDHLRYHHLSRPYRTYHPLEERDGRMCHAARECVSMSFGRRGQSLVGIVVFDPPRRLVKVAIEYTFSSGGKGTETEAGVTVFPELPAFRDVFLKLFRCVSATCCEGISGVGAKNVFRKCQSIVRQCAFEAESQVLGVLTRSLDDVELSLSKDAVVREALDAWRGNFGRWRNTLFHQEGSLRHLRQTTQWVERDGSAQSAGVSVEHSSLKLHAQVLDAVIEENAAMRRRLDSVYHAVMSTMQIVESKRAIEEAEMVSKLTHLAFFFIPLTLVTGVFGMNITEFNGELGIGAWAGTSLCVTIASYFILHRREIVHLAVQMPQHVRSLSMRRLSGIIFKWIRMIQSMAPKAAWWQVVVGVTVIAVSGIFVVVGIWMVASGAAKTSPNDGFWTVLSALFLIVFVYMSFYMVRVWRGRRKRRVRLDVHNTPPLSWGRV
ncbi:hypothetical protein QBC34DRAFT_456517 [Podospora aff. communis PSN243]|uniref:Uncharacterized protein n=1 Tax=Podospora aff. communis PSN243 TaxID=3040156 RepID=A0AAV9GX24_9PEZI|nr:hypothetical protein QBC34DRAFT_456517 [Podospora aff. communis PSN243]